MILKFAIIFNQNHQKFDLKSNQNHFMESDLNKIKITKKSDLNQ